MADVDIAHYIEIDGIGRWSHRVVGASKTEERHATDAQVLATVEMRSPVGAVLQPDILYAYVAAIRDIEQSGPLLIFVQTIPVPAASQPEGLVETKPVAVDCAASADGKSVNVVSIDERAEVEAGFTLDAGGCSMSLS